MPVLYHDPRYKTGMIFLAFARRLISNNTIKAQRKKPFFFDFTGLRKSKIKEIKDMTRTDGYMIDVDSISLLSSDMEACENYLNKNASSTTLPEEVYWVLSVITSSFYGRRR